MIDYDIHSCGYYCDRPACIKAQRDELRNKMFSDQAVKTYSGGKPNYTQPDEALMKRVMDGMPDMPIKVQDEREANYKSFAQSAQVIGGQYDPRRKPSGSWTSWDNTMCNPLADARMQTQSAWQDGYDSAKAEGKGMSEPVAYIDVETRNLSWAKLTRWETPTVVKMDKVPLYITPPKKEWVGLTDAEIEDMLKGSKNAYDAVERIEAKLKEKNT